MRNRIEKKEESYMPSIETKKEEETKPEKPIEEKKEDIYVPKPSYKEPISLSIGDAEPKKVDNDIKPEEPEEKPRFTLRLRDRQKKDATT